MIDEGNEYKNDGSAQRQAMGVLANKVHKVLLLTGTLMGVIPTISFFCSGWRFDRTGFSQEARVLELIPPIRLVLGGIFLLRALPIYHNLAIAQFQADIVLTDPTNSNSGVLRLYGGTVGFTMPASLTADGLIVHYTRHDPITRAEVVTVTHAGGTTPVPNTMAGQNRGDFEIACPFTGITSWTIAGGAETWITEICLLLTPGSI